jgi:hypothetical protein
MFLYTTNTLYNHTITGCLSDEVVTEDSSVLCYITMNLTAFIKCVRVTTPVPQYGGSFTKSPDLYPNVTNISHFKDELD